MWVSVMESTMGMATAEEGGEVDVVERLEAVDVRQPVAAPGPLERPQRLLPAVLRRRSVGPLRPQVSGLDGLGHADPTLLAPSTLAPVRHTRAGVLVALLCLDGELERPAVRRGLLE